MLKKIVVITHLEQLCTLLIQNTEDIMRSARRIGFDNGLGQPRSGQASQVVHWGLVILYCNQFSFITLPLGLVFLFGFPP